MARLPLAMRHLPKPPGALSFTVFAVVALAAGALLTGLHSVPRGSRYATFKTRGPPRKSGSQDSHEGRGSAGETSDTKIG